MAGINALSPVTAPHPSPAGAAAPRRAQADDKPDFGSMLREVIDKVDADQQRSALAVRDLVAGRSQDVLSVVSEVANADLSFKLLIGVRNKMIEAYKQTMNMQI